MNVSRRRLASVAVVVLLAGCGSPVPPSAAGPSASASVPPVATASPPATASPSPSATASPTETIAPEPTNPPPATSGGLVWRRVSEPTGVLFTRIIPDGTGFLAVATNDSSEATDYAPTFWRSATGITWHQIHLTSLAPFVAARPDLYSYVVTGLVRAGAALVAVGARMLLDASAADVAMWYSPDDGTTWHRVASGGSFPDAFVYDVTAGPTGFVAVGSDGYPGASTQDTGTRGAAVWTSPDGARWTRAPAQAAFSGAFMTRVIATGTGFMASGRIHADVAPGGTAPAPPIWTSADGKTWHRAPRSASLAQADDLAVNQVSSGYVATGTVFDSVAGSRVGAAWWSSDGATWKRASAGPGDVASVASIGGRLVAVGIAATSGATSSYEVGAWTSTNGHAWHAIPTIAGFDAASVLDSAVNAVRLVVIGESADPNSAGTTGFVWVAVPT